eukprot:scaffold33632_cov135-Isochrysis_galbana.AAC.6
MRRDVRHERATELQLRCCAPRTMSARGGQGADAEPVAHQYRWTVHGRASHFGIGMDSERAPRATDITACY